MASPERFSHSRSLFITDLGPMRFFVRPGPLKRQLSPLITHGGGIMCRVQEPGAFLLAEPGQVHGVHYMSSTYITDCVRSNRRLSARTYRLVNTGAEPPDKRPRIEMKTSSAPKLWDQSPNTGGFSEGPSKAPTTVTPASCDHSTSVGIPASCDHGTSSGAPASCDHGTTSGGPASCDHGTSSGAPASCDHSTSSGAPASCDHGTSSGAPASCDHSTSAGAPASCDHGTSSGAPASCDHGTSSGAPASCNHSTSAGAPASCDPSPSTRDPASCRLRDSAEAPASCDHSVSTGAPASCNLKASAGVPESCDDSTSTKTPASCDQSASAGAPASCDHSLSGGAPASCDRSASTGTDTSCDPSSSAGAPVSCHFSSSAGAPASCDRSPSAGAPASCNLGASASCNLSSSAGAPQSYSHSPTAGAPASCDLSPSPGPLSSCDPKPTDRATVINGETEAAGGSMQKSGDGLCLKTSTSDTETDIGGHSARGDLSTCAMTSQCRTVPGRSAPDHSAPGPVRRFPFSRQEDITILLYVKENETPTKLVTGNLFWKEMEKKQLLNRTWQAMKCRYTRYIVRHKHLYREAVQAASKAALSENPTNVTNQHGAPSPVGITIDFTAQDHDMPIAETSLNTVHPDEEPPQAADLGGADVPDGEHKNVISEDDEGDNCPGGSSVIRRLKNANRRIVTEGTPEPGQENCSLSEEVEGNRVSGATSEQVPNVKENQDTDSSEDLQIFEIANMEFEVDDDPHCRVKAPVISLKDFVMGEDSVSTDTQIQVDDVTSSPDLSDSEGLQEALTDLMSEFKLDIYQVTQALLKNNGEVGSTRHFLRTGLRPDGFPIWNHRDDEDLQRCDPTVQAQLARKYGADNVAKRAAFLSS